MYWPLSAPRVYAAPSKPELPLEDGHDVAQNGDEEKSEATALLGMQISRNGHIFATITVTTLNIWQSSPVTLITSAERSISSLKSYGQNVGVVLRPDCSIAAVQTSQGFLVTYNITFDQASRVYQQIRVEDKTKRLASAARLPIEEARYGQREIHLRFRMVIKVDAGIGKAIALDDELIVATETPAAVQCIRWTPDDSKNQTTTELLSRLSWMGKKSVVRDVIYDRAMSLFIWISSEGKAYAVQKIIKESQKIEGQGKYFKGYGFHNPQGEEKMATTAAINARFSLLAIGCKNGDVAVYSARDYAGSLPLSHVLSPPASLATTGTIRFLSYSPDGYCLFVGYENGWVTWSVYGKLGGNSFNASKEISVENDDGWLLGTLDGGWIGGGAEIIFTSMNDDRLWVLEFARSAVTGCFCPSNISRTLLYSASTLMIYNGHDVPDITSLSSEESLWTHVQIPPLFLINQRPIRCAVISSDGRYLAVAGRRGLAHYSIHSGRWKTFDDLEAESSFVVRGGICWHQHILVAAVDTGDQDEIRLYSRETGLTNETVLHREKLSSPAVVISLSGEDSLLVYTYENNLYHYVINISGANIQLVCVGQIGLHGIIRAPARVRAVTWYIPDHQLLDGDPSHDVVTASVLFLVDAKLVLLQPTTDDNGSLKYDMRIIASNVEYFSFTRDQIPLRAQNRLSPSIPDQKRIAHSLVDSLWYFNGRAAVCWPDMSDLIKVAAVEGVRDLPEAVVLPLDFYPSSIGLNKAILIGLEPDLVQRRDTHLAYFRFSLRNDLFLPSLLKHHLSNGEASQALSLAHHYASLPYFAHALELLLHTVLDEEVDSPSAPDIRPLLPTVLSFLSSFPCYLDVLVQCTRKTEVRSWRTLFETLPSPAELFEESLARGLLKTAGGYLIVLCAFEGEEGLNGDKSPGTYSPNTSLSRRTSHTPTSTLGSSRTRRPSALSISSISSVSTSTLSLPSSAAPVKVSRSATDACVRLLFKARAANEWELCKELARFLMALDGTGNALREAMTRLDGEPPPTPGWFGRDRGLSIDEDEAEDLVSPKSMVMPIEAVTGAMGRTRLSSYDGSDENIKETNSQKGKDKIKVRPALISQYSVRGGSAESEEDLATPGSASSVIIRRDTDRDDGTEDKKERRRSSYFGSKA